MTSDTWFADEGLHPGAAVGAKLAATRRATVDFRRGSRAEKKVEVYLTPPTESGGASNGAERNKDADIVAVTKRTFAWNKSECSENFLI